MSLMVYHRYLVMLGNRVYDFPLTREAKKKYTNFRVRLSFCDKFKCMSFVI